MNLDDPIQIDQALRTYISEVEVLYWVLEDSLYNYIGKAKSIYIMLLYLAKYNKELLVQGLKNKQRERLKEISYELFSDKIITNSLPIEIKPAISPYKIPFEKEKHLQQYLFEHPDLLCAALEDNVKVTGLEVQTDFDYRCDLVA